MRASFEADDNLNLSGWTTFYAAVSMYIRRSKLTEAGLSPSSILPLFLSKAKLSKERGSEVQRAVHGG